MHDVIETIRGSRPDAEDLTPLDVHGIARRARRREVASRAVVAVVAVAGLAGGIATLDAVLPDRGVYVGPGQPGVVDRESPRSGQTGPGADPGEAGDPGDLDEAIERLIEASRRAEPRPVADEPGEVLVERTYAIWSATSVSSVGTSHELEVTWYEARTDADGRTEVFRQPLASLEPTDDLTALRDAAQQHFAAGAPEVEGEAMRGSGRRATVYAALDEAERDSRGSAEPAPGSTERPDQAHAFIRAADALREGLQPEDRIRALEVIGRLDPSLVEYRGAVLDLLGREGIGIAGRDGDGWGATNWNVLIFDPETGDLLGEYTEFEDGVEVDAPPITSYTARETVLLRTED